MPFFDTYYFLGTGDGGYNSSKAFNLMFGQCNCLRFGVNDPSQIQFDCGPGAGFFAKFFD